MDYEKKYKEALERAKEQAIDGYLDAVAVSDIFPELAESEDERMKKAIIATIHLYYGEPLEDEAKEMIAWLEKQSKKKIAWSEKDEQNFIESVEALEDSFKFELADWLKERKLLFLYGIKIKLEGTVIKKIEI